MSDKQTCALTNLAKLQHGYKQHITQNNGFAFIGTAIKMFQ